MEAACQICSSTQCNRLITHRRWSLGNASWEKVLEAEEECLDRKRDKERHSTLEKNDA